VREFISKGAVIMAKPEFINIVTTECSPEHEARFNKWYNEVHIPMLLKCKGLNKAARYKIVEENVAKPRYIAIYEYASKEAMAAISGSPEFKAAIEEMQTSWKGGGFEIKGALNCEPIMAWEK
jgi:quinol monooxygenase YgiN